MKPLLERRRRARMSKCLDELKHLLMGSMKVSFFLTYTVPHGYLWVTCNPLGYLQATCSYEPCLFIWFLAWHTIGVRTRRRNFAVDPHIVNEVVAAIFIDFFFQISEEVLNRMEKADILEMVVQHMQNLRTSSRANRYQVSFSVLRKDREGELIEVLNDRIQRLKILAGEL